MVTIAVTCEAAAQPGLPMAGETPPYATLRYEPDEKSAPALQDDPFNHAFPIVVVYRQQGDWFRVTPDGFVPEAWISRGHVELNASLPVPEHPDYLGLLTVEYERRRSRDDRYCAVLLEDSPHYYDQPNGRRHTLDLGRKGRIFLAGEPAAGWVQTYSVPRPGEAVDPLELADWYQEHLLSKPVARFPDGQCVQKLPRDTEFIVEKDGGYREGPADALSPRSFYTAGARVLVTKRYAGDWLATELPDGPHQTEEVWFPEADATPAVVVATQTLPATFPAPAATTTDKLRIRAAPHTSAAILHTLDAGERLLVFASREGWYRVTADGFSPEGWVAAQFVTFTSDFYDGPLPYLAALTSAHPAVNTPPTAQSRGGIGCFGWFLLLAAAGVLMAIIVTSVQSAQKRRQKEERARREQESTQSSLQSSLAQIAAKSMEVFELVPRHLREAEAALDRAEIDFTERAFAPFWSSIEKTAVQLGAVDNCVRHLTTTSGEYEAIVVRYKGRAQPFPIGSGSVARMAATTVTLERLSTLVRRAQRDFQFATIYEQRKTNQILTAGFTTLAQALEGMGERIAASIEEVGERLGDMAAALGNVSESLDELHGTVRQSTTDMKKRHDRALEMLDNIQRRRKPYPGSSW